MVTDRAGTFPVRRQPHQQRHLGDRPRHRGRRRSDSSAGRGASYLALSPDGAAFTAPTSIPTAGDIPRRRRNRRSRSSTRRGRWSWNATALHNVAGVFHVALSRGRAARNGRAAASQEPDPAGARGARLGVRQFDLGVRRGRRAKWCSFRSTNSIATITPPFGVAIAPDKSAAYISTTGSDSVTVIRSRSCWRFIRAADSGERRTLANDLSASANYVVARIPVGHAPEGTGALARRQAPLRRESDGRHHLDHRHARRGRSTGTLSLGAPADAHRRAPRRAALLHRALRLPGPLRLRQLPPRSDLRRPVVGPGAGRLRQGHRR